MNLFNTKLSRAFSVKQVIKVIAGLDNTNIQSIIKLANLAELAGCTYIDIIANPKIVSIVKALVNIPVCVSSISPIELYNCVQAGADFVELGNFDIFYKKNINFTSQTILDLALETRDLIRNRDICVTVPHHLNLLDQMILAQNLEIIGINIIQTEGCTNKESITQYTLDKLLISTNLAASTLSSTYAISKSVNIPVITSSNMNVLSSPMALFYGASGIGIGSFFKNKNDTMERLLYAQEIVASLCKQNQIHTNKLNLGNNYIMYANNYHNFMIR